jgi:hypothetical protein
MSSKLSKINKILPKIIAISGMSLYSFMNGSRLIPISYRL